MAPTEEEKDIMANDREIVIRPTLPLRIKSKRPPLLTANTKLQDLVDEEQKRRLPQVVNPEDIDGLPFPSVTGKEETVTGGNSPTMRAVALTGSTLDREMGEGLQEVFASMPSRLVTPSLPTLEKATSVAIYFETLYHALLKPPKSLDAAHPNNYILNRRRRELALEQEMEKRNCSEQEKTVLRARWREEETQALREKRKKVGTLSFAKLKVIGHGAFGVVSLVKEKETGKLFAMKELRKADMLRKGQEGHVRAEKDLLAAAANSSAGAQWIVTLHYSFQDVDRLYLVLTYEGGGDLLNLLVERDTFEEDFTRFYIAEMILAIEATHKLGFIHRDIKPDNFLFSKEGHLRISDFGLANDLHWAHDNYYYDQQRRALLKKHGIDLEEPSKMKLKTMKRREVEAIMGKDWLNQGQGMLTWRDGKRRKLAMSVCG
jgi:protein-serine/threonine kinase